GGRPPRAGRVLRGQAPRLRPADRPARRRVQRGGAPRAGAGPVRRHDDLRRAGGQRRPAAGRTRDRHRDEPEPDPDRAAVPPRPRRERLADRLRRRARPQAATPPARGCDPRLTEMKRVVVIGGGFGGLLAARGLRGADVEVTLVDRQNFHLFQPLAYQVATGALSSVEIATPLRQILRRQKNARVLLAEATGFDLDARTVRLGRLANGEDERSLEYDTLVVAGGSAYSYFGHDEWARYAPELKSLEGALDLRSRILSAFEAAEVELDPVKRAAWLTFVVVGGGPTGVEMAGQIGELARDTLRRDYRV